MCSVPSCNAIPPFLKLAVAGKGGVGKTTLSATLTHLLARDDHQVLAVDADPNNCLGRALGFPEEVLSATQPLSEMRELLSARAGTGEGGNLFRFTPQVEDLLERYRLDYQGMTLLVMGTIDTPGAGCVCPESTVLKALMRHLVDVYAGSIIMDMEAGLEHLGRGTARAMHGLVIVAEPTAVSARTAARVAKLAHGLELAVYGVVLNKTSPTRGSAQVREHLGDLPVLIELPWDQHLTATEAVPQSGPYWEAASALLALLTAAAVGSGA